MGKNNTLIGGPLGLKTKLEEAIAKDPKIAATVDQISEHPGVTPEYLQTLGLSEVDLKKLERKGLAIRAYTKNIYFPGDPMPNGKTYDCEKVSVPVLKSETILNDKGYERIVKYVDMEERPIYHYRGNGSKVVWILINKNV